MSPRVADADPRKRRPRIDRDFVMAYRRRRFVLAAVEIAHEFGRTGITATTLCQVAHTARNTFYDTFESVDDCLRHAAGEIEAELFAPVGKGDPDGEWLPEVNGAIAGLYAAVAAEPLLAEFLFAHSFAIKDGGEAAYERGVTALVALLKPGRRVAESLGHRPPPLAEEMAARMILSLATRRVLGGEADELAEESPKIAHCVGTIFFGAQAAALMLGIEPAPDSRPTRSRPVRQPLAGSGAGEQLEHL